MVTVSSFMGIQSFALDDRIPAYEDIVIDLQGQTGHKGIWAMPGGLVGWQWPTGHKGI